MIPAPLTSLESLRDAFTIGLGRLLAEGAGIGAFVLALANASYDPALRTDLDRPLRRRFQALARDCAEALAAGHQPAGPTDDVAVFTRLMESGLDALAPCRRRAVGPWEAQLNPLRALRPARAAGRPPAGLHVPFDPAGFHFNRPFLRQEAFWAGRLGGIDAELLYNKFPFVDRHAILVPERERCQPQYLTERHHCWAWALMERLAETLPGVGLGYNSLGAYASVNHLHFQLFVRTQPLPVALPDWRHNGGPDPYPADCERHTDSRIAWQRLAELQASEGSFNLIYRPGQLYCLPRRRQGDYPLPAWCVGQAWYELAGGVIVFNAEDFEALDAAQIASALAQTRLAPGSG
ncbi:MAG: hypothetical protein MUC77_08865 [Chromatiaceae bacterium]|nr:hypothetical protein [Chromatiaceae bacterium]